MSALVVAISIVGCSRNATVLKSDGARISAVVERGDEDSIVLRNPKTAERVTVPREEIVEIYHPGSAAAVSGAVLAGLGGVVAGYGIATIVRLNKRTRENADPENPLANEGAGLGYWFGTATIVVGGVGLLSGAGVGLWGLNEWTSSRRRARVPAWTLRPVATPDGPALVMRAIF